jgi:ABC-2 type transport system ATP-binding protein
LIARWGSRSSAITRERGEVEQPSNRSASSACSHALPAAIRLVVADRYHPSVLSVRGLTKIYAGRAVVDDVSFDLQPGTVTAFLGPNGAGKSTTLRMVTGLTPPTRGGSWIAGKQFREWPNPGHVAGVLLDASAVHPGRTGGAHMRNAAALMGVPARRADELLAQLGLEDATRKKIGTYSLGMRQRLGLAHVLLADPPLLMLDEPINGLDPVGIRAVRELLRGHAARGGTVLLSSHVLSEVDQTADRIVMIGGGRIVADGPIRELLASHQSLVRGPDMQAVAKRTHGRRRTHSAQPRRPDPRRRAERPRLGHRVRGRSEGARHQRPPAGPRRAVPSLVRRDVMTRPMGPPRWARPDGIVSVGAETGSRICVENWSIR